MRTLLFVRANGDGEIRTLDPLLARQVLSQLSYTPIKKSGIHLLSHIVTNIVSSAAQVLTIVFGMGTGVTPERIDTGNFHFQATLIAPPKASLFSVVVGTTYASIPFHPLLKASFHRFCLFISAQLTLYPRKLNSI